MLRTSKLLSIKKRIFKRQNELGRRHFLGIKSKISDLELFDKMEKFIFQPTNTTRTCTFIVRKQR